MGLDVEFGCFTETRSAQRRNSDREGLARTLCSLCLCVKPDWRSASSRLVRYGRICVRGWSARRVRPLPSPAARSTWGHTAGFPRKVGAQFARRSARTGARGLAGRGRALRCKPRARGPVVEFRAVTQPAREARGRLCGFGRIRALIGKHGAQTQFPCGVGHELEQPAGSRRTAGVGIETRLDLREPDRAPGATGREQRLQPGDMVVAAGGRGRFPGDAAKDHSWEYELSGGASRRRGRMPHSPAARISSVAPRATTYSSLREPGGARPGPCGHWGSLGEGRPWIIACQRRLQITHERVPLRAVRNSKLLLHLGRGGELVGASRPAS